jgi:hypothetical protein
VFLPVDARQRRTDYQRHRRYVIGNRGGVLFLALAQIADLDTMSRCRVCGRVGDSRQNNMAHPLRAFANYGSTVVWNNVLEARKNQHEISGRRLANRSDVSPYDLVH